MIRPQPLLALSIILASIVGQSWLGWASHLEEYLERDLVDFSYYHPASDECGKHSMNATKYALASGSRRPKYQSSGGFSAGLGEFPSFAYVSAFDNRTKENNLCGGALVSDQVVLTTRDCLGDELGEKNIKVLLGRSDLKDKSAGKEVQVTDACYHKRILAFKNIALLVLKDPVQFTDTIQPACLPSEPIRPHQQAFVAGFGQTSGGVYDGPYEFAEKLQVLPVKKKNCPDLEKNSAICFGPSSGKSRGSMCLYDWGSPVYANIRGKQTIFGTQRQVPSSTCKAGVSEYSGFQDAYMMRSDIASMIKDCSKLIKTY